MEEKNIRNKIITLSGEPVSGKGTTVKVLIEKLKQAGYLEENIHLETTGNDFRRYFNSIIDLISKIESPEELKKMINRDELKVLLNNEEHRKILAKTIANLRKKQVDLSNFTIEQANNGDDFMEIRRVIDSLIDEGMKNKGKVINSKESPNDIWIIDSRLAFHNIPEAFSIRLTTNPKVAGERLYNDKSRGKEDSKYETIEQATKEREERRVGEKERYMNRYGVNLEEESNYDLIIDTSYSTPEEIANVILQCEKNFEENKEFSQKWASPKIFLPLQTERDTLARSMYSMEEMINEINKHGFLLDQQIEVIEVDGIKYIIEGHHRNFATALSGRTLIPYKIVAKDDEKINQYSNTARERAESLNEFYLKGHEWMFKNIDEEFSYNKIYPQLSRILEDNENII